MNSSGRPRVGIVGIPGKWSTETLADEVETRTGFRLVVDMSGVALDLGSRRLLFGAHDLSGLDGLMVKKISAEYSPNTLDRLEMLRVAENAGVRVFSRAERVLRLVDRLSCTVTLRNAGIPMPETLITEDLGAAMAAVERFGAAVLKPLFSTKARGMRVVHAAEDELEAAIRDFQRENPMMYIQRRVDLPGRDLGMVFLAGEYLGIYARVQRTVAWNTATRSGGRYVSHEPSGEIIDLARRAQAPFGLDFTTVDVAETAGGPIVFEVSAFGGFRGAKEGIGINAAARYVEHALKELETK